MTTLATQCQWWRHQVYTPQRTHVYMSLVRRRQINKYFCKYYSIGLELRNHAGLLAIPGMGEWVWACGPGMLGRLWPGWGGERRRKSFPGRGRSTQSAVHWSTWLNLWLRERDWKNDRNVKDRWTLESLCVMLKSVDLSWALRRDMVRSREERWLWQPVEGSEVPV